MTPQNNMQSFQEPINFHYIFTYKFVESQLWRSGACYELPGFFLFGFKPEHFRVWKFDVEKDWLSLWREAPLRKRLLGLWREAKTSKCWLIPKIVLETFSLNCYLFPYILMNMSLTTKLSSNMSPKKFGNTKNHEHRSSLYSPFLSISIKELD